MPELPSFVKSIRNYFDMKAADAIAEYKNLTEKDKEELSAMLNAEVGYEHTPYMAKSTA